WPAVETDASTPKTSCAPWATCSSTSTRRSACSPPSTVAPLRWVKTRCCATWTASCSGSWAPPGTCCANTSTWSGSTGARC
ncbi:MAG: hypothetical protein AVDCRST_MAG77-1968, partial [uncultured Chloroflexi bacterium]